MTPTQHALQRWGQRFPGRDMALVYARARNSRVGKKMKRRIRESCPGHDSFMRGIFKGAYYKITPDWIVFVVTPPETIITVFQLNRENP